MSDLQISLLIIGAAVVCGVYLFNWRQQRKFQRKLEEAFDAERDDVLLDTARASPDRLEPQLARIDEPPEAPATPAAHPPEEQENSALPGAAPRSAPHPQFDAMIDFVAAVESDTVLPGVLVDELLGRTAACGKPCRSAGYRADSGQWEELARGAGSRYRRVELALQLVNRAGPVRPPQLAMFCDAVRDCAERMGASATCPDTQEALQRTRDLDALCAEVDVAIGVNIVAMEGQTFPGSKIRALAEAAGFKLEPDGIFRFHGDHNQTLFTLDNHEPAPFLPEQIRSLSTSGITLLLDVPRIADGLDVFDRMLAIARSLAQSLGGRLVDDNRVALNDAGIVKIRQQLARIFTAMEDRGVGAGSARALRIFA